MHSPKRPAQRPPAALFGVGLLLALLTSALAFGPTARASLAEALDMRELVRRSSYVVTAMAIGQRASYDARGRIVTDVELEVQQSVRGPARLGQRLTLRCLGGRIGELGMRVEGEPRFEDGQESLLFLARARSGDLRPVGMSQGVMRIDRGGAEAQVLPGGEGLSLVQRVAGGRTLRAPGALLRPEPLTSVLRRVEALSAELSAEGGASHE